MARASGRGRFSRLGVFRGASWTFLSPNRPKRPSGSRICAPNRSFRPRRRKMSPNRRKRPRARQAPTDPGRSRHREGPFGHPRGAARFAICKTPGQKPDTCLALSLGDYSALSLGTATNGCRPFEPTLERAVVQPLARASRQMTPFASIPNRFMATDSFTPAIAAAAHQTHRQASNPPPHPQREIGSASPCVLRALT